MNACIDDENCGSLPFPEKRAWLTLAAGLACYGTFIATVMADAAAGLSVLRLVILFTVALTVQGVLVGIGTPIMAFRDPAEAKAPLDERDRSIARRSVVAAYATLIAGVLILSMGVPYATADWQISFAAMLAMIVADMVRNIAVIILYRRRNG